MISQYGKEKGTSVYYAYVNKHGYDDTKPFPGKKEEYGPGTLIEKPFQPKKLENTAYEDFKKKLEEEMNSMKAMFSQPPIKSEETKIAVPKVEEFKTKGITMGNDKSKPWY